MVCPPRSPQIRGRSLLRLRGLPSVNSLASSMCRPPRTTQKATGWWSGYTGASRMRYVHVPLLPPGRLNFLWFFLASVLRHARIRGCRLPRCSTAPPSPCRPPSSTPGRTRRSPSTAACAGPSSNFLFLRPAPLRWPRGWILGWRLRHMFLCARTGTFLLLPLSTPARMRW